MKRLTAIFLLLVLAAGLFGCRMEELRSPASFYYYRSDPVFAGTDGVICPETRELAGMEGDLDAILELYFQGPISRELENLIPESCPAPQWELDGNTLHLHFTQELAALSGVELTLVSACLTRTFLELTGCNTLILSAEGMRLNGETSMVLTLDGLSLRDDSMDRLRGEHTIYYADASRRYLIGQCTEAVILGSLCAMGMLILGLPNVLMISVLVSVCALIPIVGAWVSAIVGAFLILIVDPGKALIFLIFLVILQQLEGNLIYPRVVGGKLHLPGIWVLAAVTIGGGIAGPFGMLMGVPLAAGLYSLLREWTKSREQKKLQSA